MRVVVNRDFLGGRADIGFGNAELSDAGKCPRQDQIQKLMRGHVNIGEQQKRQAEQAGEARKPKDNALAVFLLCAQAPHKGVRDARAHAAEHSRNGGNHRRIVKARLDDKDAADKGDGHARHLREIRLFPQEENREENREEGRQLIEHIRVGQIQMPDGVEIANQPERAEEASAEQVGDILLFGDGADFFASHHDRNIDERDKIAEKGFLHGGQVARELDEKRHQRKAERRNQNIDNALCL